MEGNSSLKRKHAETEEDRLRGLFTDDTIPKHFYPIGENFFVLARPFQNKPAIHIRKYNKYDGEKYYPSTCGITLSVEQFQVIFKHGPPMSIFDIAEINMALENVNPDEKKELYILMTDDSKYSLTKETTVKSGRVYKNSNEISFHQWAAIRKLYDDVISSYISVKFACRDLVEVFRIISRRSLPTEKPVGELYKQAEMQMNQYLTCVLYKNIGEKKGIHPPMRLCDESLELDDLVSVEDFNESCMFLNVVGVMRDFEKELKENKLYGEDKFLIDFLSESYLKAVKLDDCIEYARKDFCSVEL